MASVLGSKGVFLSERGWSAVIRAEGEARDASMANRERRKKICFFGGEVLE